MCSQRSVGFRPYQKHLLFSTIYFENGEKTFGYKSELVRSGRVMLAVDRKGKGGGYNDSLGCSRLRAQYQHGAGYCQGEHWCDEAVGLFLTPDQRIKARQTARTLERPSGLDSQSDGTAR